jgi:hypothetical protein
MTKNIFLSIPISLSIFLACSSSQKESEKTAMQFTAERSPAWVPPQIPPSQIFKHRTQLNEVNWRNLLTELSFQNMRKQARDEQEFQAMLRSSMYYAKKGANQTYWDILRLSPNSADAAFNAREELMGWDGSINANVDSRSKPAPQMEAVTKLGAGSLVSTLRASVADPNQRLKPGTNYFRTRSGQAVLESLKDYVLVIIPGFGSHTIQDYSWPEIVRQANEYYGRKDESNPNNPYQRVARTTKSTPREKLGEDLVLFHRTNQNPDVKFDIIHPLGFELGFSMGRDEESAQELANRLSEIKKIPAYKDKKFILLGYSKGAPIATKMVAIRPDIGRDVVAVVTMAGVVQGALPANSLMDDLVQKSGKKRFPAAEEYLKTAKDTFNRSYEKINARYEGLSDGYFNQLESAKNSSEYGRRLSEIFGRAFNLEGSGIQNALREPRDREKMIEGINDMSNFQSIRWNLQNMNDESFRTPITFFNFSMLTNVKDFVMPNPGNLNVALTAPTVVPQLYYNAGFGIDYSRFSRDNVFLYLTSISGFEEAAGGLFDTQVEWLDTKSTFLDSRPLAYSLSKSQLEIFNEVVLSDRDPNKRLTIQGSEFLYTPRHQLVNILNERRRKTSNNINVVDLGDFRGTHWDVAFEQVYKPKTQQKFYTHQFPRRAVQASILELLAIYKTTGGF